VVGRESVEITSSNRIDCHQGGLLRMTAGVVPVEPESRGIIAERRAPVSDLC